MADIGNVTNIDDLLQRWGVVRDETSKGANTHERIGGLGADTVATLNSLIESSKGVIDLGVITGFDNITDSGVYKYQMGQNNGINGLIFVTSSPQRDGSGRDYQQFRMEAGRMYKRTGADVVAGRITWEEWEKVGGSGNYIENTGTGDEIKIESKENLILSSVDDVKLEPKGNLFVNTPEVLIETSGNGDVRIITDGTGKLLYNQKEIAVKDDIQSSDKAVVIPTKPYNELTNPGKYILQSTTEQPFPGSDVILLVVGNYDIGYLMQTVCNPSSNKMSVRTFFRGAWSEWEEIEGGAITDAYITGFSGTIPAVGDQLFFTLKQYVVSNGKTINIPVYLKYASEDVAGMVSTESQTFSGKKTFNDSPSVPLPKEDNDVVNKKYLSDYLKRDDIALYLTSGVEDTQYKSANGNLISESQQELDLGAENTEFRFNMSNGIQYAVLATETLHIQGHDSNIGIDISKSSVPLLLGIENATYVLAFQPGVKYPLEMLKFPPNEWYTAIQSGVVGKEEAAQDYVQLNILITRGVDSDEFSVTYLLEVLNKSIVNEFVVRTDHIGSNTTLANLRLNATK